MDGIILCFTTPNNKHQRKMKDKDEALHTPVARRSFSHTKVNLRDADIESMIST